MALVVADRVKETTTTTGTGTYTLAGAVHGFQSFAAIGNGNTCYYACSDGSDYEVGIGTYTLSGTTLARTTILESSNNDAAVNWGAGEKDIFVTLPASKAIFEDASNNVAVGNNITVGGTVDGRNLSVDGAKLDNIEANATADQTAAEIEAIVNHDNLQGFVANEHIDWTASSAGTIHATNIPVVALTTVQTAANQTAHLALTAQEGDIVVRSDENKSYVHNGGTAGTMADYTELLTPTDAVLSVNGQTGAVTISNATTSSAGLMSSADKSKLDGVESGATADQTITAGAGLTGGGTGNVTISHADTSSQPSVNGSGRTYIQDITLDTFGHVTGLATATETVVDTNTTDWRVANSAGTEQFAVSAAEQVRFAGAGAASVSFNSTTQTITFSATDTNTDTTNFNIQSNSGTQVNISAGEEINFINGNATTAVVTNQTNPTVTFNHNDTSSQGSVNNSNGTVIQDVTLDGYGHVTALGSVDLDSRYAKRHSGTVTIADTTNYTQAAKVTGDRLGSGIRLAINGTSGNVVINVIADILVSHYGDIFINAISGNYTQIYIQIVSDNNENFDIRLRGTGNVSSTVVSLDIFTMAGESVTFTGTTSYSGTTLTHQTYPGSTQAASDGDAARLRVSDEAYVDTDQRVFADNYHPNADKWTTARTLSLSGDASGSVSWDGSANATLSVTVADDSHSHSNYLTSNANDTASGSYSFTNSYNAFGNSTGSVSNDGGWNARVNIAGSQHARLDVKSVSDSIITTMYAHTGQGVGKVGTFSNHPLVLMTNGSTSATISTSGSLSTTAQGTLWGSSNDGSGSGLDADLLDGIQGSSFLRSDTNDSYTGILTGGELAQGPHPVHTGYYGIWNTQAYGANSQNYMIISNGTDTYITGNDAVYIRGGDNSATNELKVTTSGSTIGGNTVWHAGNDGAGSGLDADLLDGYNSGENGASVILRSASNGYLYLSNWLYTGSSGIYAATNSAHFSPNQTTSYGTWATAGSRGGYDGILFDHGGDVAIMFDSGGNGGFYREGYGWYQYYNLSNQCTGFNTSTTSSSYTIYASGAIYATGNITAYSDARIKENVVTIDGALDKVNAMRGVYYNKIDDPEKTKEIGFIAQEVNEVLPEAVTYAEDVDQYGVKYGNVTALLIEAVKELSDQVRDLKAELEELKNA